MIQNVNSGQFMEVQDGKAESGANVQQWGGDTSKPSAHNVWHFEKVNWGYYYIYSGVGNGNTLLLNCLDDKNGSNIYIDNLLKSIAPDSAELLSILIQLLSLLDFVKMV